MKHRNGSLAILMALVMMVSFLFGCAQPAPSAPAPAPAESASAPAASEPAASASSGAALTLPREGMKFGLATREIVNDFNRDIIAGITEVIENAGGEITVVDAGADVGKHNENIENLVNSGVDGIFIELGDAQQLAPVVAKANEAGIPVVTTAVMAQVPGSICDVSADEILVSTLGSRMLLSSMNYQGDLYVFWVPGAPLLEQRKRALEALLVDFPQVNMIEVPTEHNPAKVQSQMEDILTANPDPGSIAGVWVAYDQLGTGAYQAIMSAGRNEIKMATFDGDKISYQMLYAEGSPLVCLGAEDCKNIGLLAGEAMLKALNGQTDDIRGQMYTTAYGVNRHNGIEAAKVRYGDGVWDELGLEPAEIEKAHPQTQDVYVVLPVLP